MASAIPRSKVYAPEDAAGIHRALERYANRRLYSPPEENLEVFKRNLDINESGIGPWTLSALQRHGYRPRRTILERAQRQQPSDFGSFWRSLFQPRTQEPPGLARPGRSPRREQPRAVRVSDDAQPRAVQSEAVPTPRRAPDRGLQPEPQRVAEPEPQRVAQPKPQRVSQREPERVPQPEPASRPTPRAAARVHDPHPPTVPGMPVPQRLRLNDPRIGPVQISDTSEATAIRTLQEHLQRRGERVVAGRRYAVFLDPIQRSPGDFDGRAYVLEGRRDGSLFSQADFAASTQPTNYEKNLDSRYHGKYYESWAYGPPTIDARYYPRVSSVNTGSFGGSFVMGTVPATRYGGHEIRGTNRENATEILIHREMGSLGCLRVRGFNAFANWFEGTGNFDIAVARYARY